MTSLCDNLQITDAQPHHPCYNWNWNRSQIHAQCEIDWPCEVRQYLQTVSSFIWITRFLLSYGTVIIIILGLFLNFLSLYTFISSGLSKSGCGVYLISLAICDCGNLITNYGVGIGRAYLPNFNNIFMNSEWLCRWHGVFVEVFQLISAWIVVSFTVERCLAIWYPMLIRHTSRTRRARKVVFGVVAAFTAFSLSKLVLTGFEKDSVFGYQACYSHRFRWHGVAYLRVAFQTWIPTILVFTFNILIFWKLRRIKKKRMRLTEVKRDTTSGSGGAGRPRSIRQGSFLSRRNHAAPMLAAVSLAYLILVFPLGVTQTIELFWNVENNMPFYNNEGRGDKDVDAREDFIQWKNTKLLLKYVRSFFFGFYQINFCVNFFLYFAAGVQFRLHLQKKAKEWSDYFSSENNDNFGGGGDRSHRETGGSGVDGEGVKVKEPVVGRAFKLLDCERAGATVFEKKDCNGQGLNVEEAVTKEEGTGGNKKIKVAVDEEKGQDQGHRDCIAMMVIENN